MRFLFKKAPDGGFGSGVTGYFLCEFKRSFSVVVLHFAKGTRDAYHDHAFNAVTVWLKGQVREHHLDGRVMSFSAGQWKYTPRTTFHKIEALESTWAISIRGRWANSWHENRRGKLITLTHGRKEIMDDEVPW